MPCISFSRTSYFHVSEEKEKGKTTCVSALVSLVMEPEAGKVPDLRWGSPEIPMKSAYLVMQGYANICKMVSIVIFHK